MLNAVFPARTDERDVAAYLLVIPALIAIPLLAAYIPPSEPLLLDPMRALRYE